VTCWPRATGSAASTNGTNGGTLGLAAGSGGNLWILVAQAQRAQVGGPPQTGPVPPIPPLLLHWSAGSWAKVAVSAPVAVLVGGGPMPILLSAGQRAAQAAGFSTVPALVPGFTPDGWGWLHRPAAGYGQITTVPGAGQLWAVGGDWIARYG
jgi:hypothetical protein